MDNHLHAKFHALADPTRLAVVERLLKAPASVSELAEPHDMALPAFTKHLGVLERSGLITSEKTGRVRTCSINPAAMNQLEKWFSDRRALWDMRLSKLSDHLIQNKKD
ncbi:MAG: metalloregulator ArsR/SmtB family transcription factor [Pseudomonadota bacterium]